jgi:eukaryotic-like serine/threonine-protein kinase
VSTRIGTDTVVDGRYRVVDRLGSGGMADVYCAEDLQLGRNVALKMLHPRFAEDQEFVERFRREASAAAGLNHQNVVSVYDRGEWDGTSYIAMEHVDGRTLKQVVQDEAPLEPERAIGLTEQVLRAARFAHRRGIIHRDLKPHNVIVDEEGRAKVTDFGIAKAGASDMTQTGSIMGTAQYLSPEQAQGVAVDARSDLYSTGIILYELLTGRVPFDGDSAVTIALKQVNERPIPPSHFNAAVTPELDGVVLRALEKDPARRFADADAFLDALAAARATLGLTAATQLAPPTDEHIYHERVVAQEPVEDDRDSRWWLWALAVVLVVAAVIAGVLLSRGTAQATVPSVVGVDQAAAETKLRSDGFDVATAPRNSSRPKGTVLGQDPPGGQKADKGSTVTLTVSDGPELRDVPTVVGLTYKSAANRLKKAGFKPARTDRNDDQVEKGRVISSSPDEGSQQRRGATVTLTVSSGPELADVPNVVGQAENDATTALQNAGFKVTVTRKETGSSEPGTVLSQSPAGGRHPKGSTVTITVAKAPPQQQQPQPQPQPQPQKTQKVTVPDIGGEAPDVARAELSAAGFKIQQKEKVVSSQEGDGIVISQDPSGGSKADKGSTVTITVGRFDGTSTQPGTGGTGTGTGTTGTTGTTTTTGAAGGTAAAPAPAAATPAPATP